MFKWLVTFGIQQCLRQLFYIKLYSLHNFHVPYFCHFFSQPHLGKPILRFTSFCRAQIHPWPINRTPGSHLPLWGFIQSQACSHNHCLSFTQTYYLQVIEVIVIMYNIKYWIILLYITEYMFMFTLKNMSTPSLVFSLYVSSSSS